MPLIGQAAFAVLFLVTGCVGVAVGLLRPRLQGRQPCRRWFALVAGILAACIVFSTWNGMYGLGQANSGVSGAVFGFFAGAIWGGLFSFLSSRVLWRAFDLPGRDSSKDYEQAMNTDVGVLIPRVIRNIRSFVPDPGFAKTGLLPWTILLAAIVLPAAWAYAFCWLTWLTEGAPGVEPVMPIKN